MTIDNSIQSIDTIIPNSEKHVQIDLKGKNLIITGGNGCGKTRFLKQIHENLSGQVEQNEHRSKVYLEREIGYRHDWIKNTPSSESVHHDYKRQLKELTEELEKVRFCNVTIGNLETYCTNFNERKALLRFFPAIREQSLAHTGSNDSLARLKQDDEHNSLSQDSSSQFERYLVAFYNYGSHLLARENDKSKGAKVDAWFNAVASQLQYLFEDESLKLHYNAEEQSFYINQDGKDPYKFDQLSSGYQSILSIYADLLMKVELKDVSAEELTGVVFIDEIDAHLHVSLQRKIFSFFDQAFPKVQFIVTTHSPFVVQSVDNSIIYDLSANEQLEDLSMYSYESILKGLLGVESKSSILDGLIEELVAQIEAKKHDWDTISDLIRRIKPNERNLDRHSRNVLMQAEILVMDSRPTIQIRQAVEGLTATILTEGISRSLISQRKPGFGIAQVEVGKPLRVHGRVQAKNKTKKAEE